MVQSLTRIPIVRNKNYMRNGLKSYVYALNKYNIVTTESSIFSRKHAQSKLMKEDGNGNQHVSQATDQMNDSFWTCPVKIGTPSQVVDLDLDSGSADCWVWSTKLDERTLATGKEQGIKVFNQGMSSTFKELNGYSWKIEYGDGSGASGTVGTDVLSIGGVAVEQAIELATAVSDEFKTQGGSGLMGLAFGKINNVQPQAVNTPVENMITQKDISNPIWSVYLGSVKDVTDPDEGKSFFTWGSYDQDVVTASKQDIAWTNIDASAGFWSFASPSMSVNGKTMDLGTNAAIADTGTTLMLVSDEVCKAIYGAIEGARYDRSAGGWLIPTGHVDKRCDVKFAFGTDKMITIEKEQLAWADLEDDSGMAYGALQSRGNTPFDIFGATWLMCCYAIFDVGNKRLGVVQRPDPTPAGK